MNVHRALTYVFDDPAWPRRLGAAFVLSLLPAAAMALAWFDVSVAAGRVLDHQLSLFLRGTVLGLASVPLHGYALRIARNVIVGSDVPLPDWDDVDDLLRNGLKLWGAYTLWGLPAMLVALTAAGLGGSQARILAGFATVVGIIVVILQPAMEARLAATLSIRAALDVPAVWRRAWHNRAWYLRLLLVVGVGLAIVTGLSYLLVWTALRGSGGTPEVTDLAIPAGILAQIVASPYVLFAYYHLIGQVYRRGADESARIAGKA
jgi:hypothetical protein